MNKESNDANDVSVSLTGYEPKYMAFSELNDSQGSFSYVSPSSDEDMDDVTLGKMLTEAHRGQADYCETEGVPVGQSSLSVVFDRAGKPVGERDVDQSIGFGVTRNTYSPHCKFSENTQAEKVVDRSGKLEERHTVLTASFLKTPKLRKWSIDRGNLRSGIAKMHRLGPYLMNRDK